MTATVSVTILNKGAKTPIALCDLLKHSILLQLPMKMMAYCRVRVKGAI